MTSELVLISTVLVIGLVTGLVTMRDALTAEMEDVAEAIGALDQTNAYDGTKNAENTAAVAGSAFGDNIDANAGDNGMFVFVAATGYEGESVIADPSKGSASAANTGSVAVGGIKVLEK